MAKESKQVLAPVELSPGVLAAVYNRVHPMLVSGVLYAQFTQLVEDPVATLTKTLPLVALLQAIYCVVCLPLSASATSSVAASSSAAARKRTAAKQTSAAPSLPSHIFPSVLSTVLAVMVGTPVLAALLVLHGAPLTTHLQHTVLCAAHFSVLATLPLFYAHGVDSSKWRALVGLSAPLDELLGASVGVFVGAWIGAVPIPLDWDREWQKWPVTVLVGGYGGWLVGKFLGGLVLKGKIARFED